MEKRITSRIFEKSGSSKLGTRIILLLNVIYNGLLIHLFLLSYHYQNIGGPCINPDYNNNTLFLFYTAKKVKNGQKYEKINPY